MEVKIIRSARRKKTISAKIAGETLEVYLPLGMSKEAEAAWVLKMKKKIEAKKFKKQLDSDNYLQKRFAEFNKKYFEGKLSAKSIKFVTNQTTVSGSCTPAKGCIRISHRLASMPRWVLDYVIMHEMVHLLHPNHSKFFWSKVNEYKYAERARGFLMCKGMETESEKQVKPA